jgi:hypothetical protein
MPNYLNLLRKTVVVFLSVITLSVVFIGKVFAVPDTAGSLLDFTADSPSAGKATITGRSSGNTNKGITIPSTVTNGGITYSVTSIGVNAFSQKGLTSVTIPNSVTSIGGSAFYNNSLTSVTIPDSVTSIGSYVFAYNNSLTSVTIGSSVTSIGSHAFGYNNSLTSVLFVGNYNAAFNASIFGGWSTTNLSTINAAIGTTGWGGVTFSTATGNVPVVLLVASANTSTNTNNNTNTSTNTNNNTNTSTNTNNNTTSSASEQDYTYTPDSPVAGEATITGRTAGNNSTTMTIPSTVTGSGTTYNVTSIVANAFRNNSLTSVTIPDSVTSIGSYAFYNNSLISVTIGNSVTSIGDNAFRNNSLTSVTIGNSVTSIGDNAFYNNSLISVTIGSSVTSIGGYAFSQNSLTSVTIPDSVISIGGYAFSQNSLTSVTIGNSVTSIGGSAFRNNSLTSVTIPDSVTSIGSYALPIPEIPQQSLPKVIRTDGTLPVASISIGASSNGGETSSTSFTADDDVTLTSKVYPESDDLGKEGELYVVMRSVIDGKKVFTALNEDGNWETWNASLKSLPAAAYVDSLEEEEEILIYSGTITAGDRIFYVGYSLFTAEGKPVITTTQSPFKITVSE